MPHQVETTRAKSILTVTNGKPIVIKGMFATHANHKQYNNIISKITDLVETLATTLDLATMPESLQQITLHGPLFNQHSPI